MSATHRFYISLICKKGNQLTALLYYYMRYTAFYLADNDRYLIYSLSSLDLLRYYVKSGLAMREFVPPDWVIRSRMLPLDKQYVYKVAHIDLERWHFTERVWVNPDYAEIQRICDENIAKFPHMFTSTQDSLGATLKEK